MQVGVTWSELLDIEEKYFEGDEITTAMESFMEERLKCRVAGFAIERMAVFLVVPDLEIVRLMPIVA